MVWNSELPQYNLVTFNFNNIEKFNFTQLHV